MGATTITLPDNIFPKASVDYAVTATFLTSNNERSTLTKNATYQYTKGNLKLSLLQDSLLVQYLESGLEKPKAAVLKGYNPEYDNISTLKLQLPARIPLNAFAASYEVVAGNLDANLELSEEAALVGLNTSRQQDSLFFALQNPRRLPYWYYVYRGEKLVARGQGNEKNFAYQHLAKGEQPYFVWVHYLWAGKMQKLAEDVPLRKHLLAMDLQAPAVVYPGQQADLKVTVKDAAGRPVPGVDLTAYAITAKFKNQHLPAIPIWDKYKKQKLNRSLVKEANETSGKKQLDWLYWRKRMGLDSIAYYNFLYPKNGIFQEYTITRDSITQISPYLVEAGRVVPVHVVYLDEVPVYFSQTDVLPPYAFAADSGYHTVKLRTADKLITLDSLYLPHKRKLIVSADLTDPENRFIQPAEKEVLTAQEQKLLYRYLLPIVPAPNHGLAYLQQGNRVHLLQRNNQDQQVNNALRRGNHLVTGPFSPTWMQYVSLDSFRTNFKMEPGYSYQFEPHLVKMREWKLPEHKIRLPKWYRWNHKPALLHEEALTDRKIQENYEATQRERLLGRLYGANTTKEYQQGRGKLGWSLENRIKTGVKLVLLHETAYPDSLLIYSKTSNILFNLKPAAYTLTLVLDNGNILTAKPTIKANGQTQVHFQEKDITVATPQSNYLLQVLDKKNAQLKKAENDKNEAQQQQLQTFRETTFSYTSGVEQFSHLVTGVVTEENGETLPGVTVVVKGTQIGTNTDAGGRFQIYVPENGILVFNFIGYVAKEEQINGRDIISVKLAPDVKMLQEVVVIGYGIQKNRAVTASASTVLQGRATGITIRGTATVKAEEAKPLIIVDGVPYSGSLANIKDKVETKILKTEEAAALYGAVAAAGVIIITTQKGGALTNGDESLFQNANAIRQNFSDYAIWQPRLTTNQQGEVSFKATFPDDVTKWHAYVLGMDNKKHSGVFQTSINSFKAMLATLHLPRFLIEGDKTTVVGKALNYLPDSALVSTRFEVGEKPMPEAQKLLKRNFTDTLGITAPVSGPDSLAVLYSLKQPNGFVDGEKRFVRLYPKGVAETVGLFLPLPTDTTFTLTFDPAKGPVRLRTQGNLLPVMLDEINYLHRYEYWCTEQAASKLKGLVLEKQIREQLGQPFAHDQIVKKLVRHLEKTQLPDGAWTWWQQGPAYAWITSHVVEALAMAGQASYPVKYQGQKLVDYFVYQLEKESSYDGLTALETLHKLQVKVDYNRYVSKFEKKKKLTLEDQLRLTRLRQHLKLPVQLDTLLKYQQQTMLGGLYWGEAKNSLFDNNISNTILAYEILKIAGNQERKLAQIRAYLLSQRRTGHWRNTYEAARVLETLLPDLLPGESGKTELLPNNVSFSGAVNYHSKRLLTDTTFVPTNSLQVKKAGNAPLYLTAYQTLWNKTPQPVQKDFRVITSFKGLKGNIPLKAGTPVDLLVEVEVKADADYVMIQVPIPAGCSYESKAGKGPYEVHREYFRQKVNIFCDKLPKGKYTYTIKLLPRFTGAYTLNPATAELMYFPTFFGRNELKQIRVQ
ncbi:MAG: carboxypeptidase-like regulatory domain-containing protein [Adhaeribacter sp.]